jgi:hypothetical protein
VDKREETKHHRKRRVEAFSRNLETEKEEAGGEKGREERWRLNRFFCHN